MVPFIYSRTNTLVLALSPFTLFLSSLPPSWTSSLFIPNQNPVAVARRSFQKFKMFNQMQLFCFTFFSGFLCPVTLSQGFWRCHGLSGQCLYVNFCILTSFSLGWPNANVYVKSYRLHIYIWPLTRESNFKSLEVKSFLCI